jgi:hypothetical protein
MASRTADHRISRTRYADRDQSPAYFIIIAWFQTACQIAQLDKRDGFDHHEIHLLCICLSRAGICCGDNHNAFGESLVLLNDIR